METRHPVEGYFGSNFRAICNHCGVMAAWNRKTWKSVEEFLRFFRKTTPYGKIFKILFRKFSPTHWLTSLCSNLWNFADRKSAKCALFTRQKKFGSYSNCRYSADRTQNLPGPAPNIWLTMLKILSKSVHFRWCYSRTRDIVNKDKSKTAKSFSLDVPSIASYWFCLI